MCPEFRTRGISINIFDKDEAQNRHRDLRKHAIQTDACNDTNVRAARVQSDLKSNKDQGQNQERPPWQRPAGARIHERQTETKPTCVAQSTANSIEPGRNDPERGCNPNLRPKPGCRDSGKERTAQPAGCAAKKDQRRETCICDEHGLVGQREKRGCHAFNRVAVWLPASSLSAISLSRAKCLFAAKEENWLNAQPRCRQSHGHAASNATGRALSFAAKAAFLFPILGQTCAFCVRGSNGLIRFVISLLGGSAKSAANVSTFAIIET